LVDVGKATRFNSFVGGGKTKKEDLERYSSRQEKEKEEEKERG